jgi:tetratricopeptide (TPR) repeat protein
VLTQEAHVFRKPREDPGAQSQIYDMINAARQAFGQNNPLAAADIQDQAADLARTQADRNPRIPEYRRTLGSVLYGLGSYLAAAGDQFAAVQALNEAEMAYFSLPAREPATARSIADVCARRSLCWAAMGARTSAVVDVQNALMAYLILKDSDDLDIARVLAIAADVLTVCIDADLGIACADRALRLYRSASATQGRGVLDNGHLPYLARAAWVSITIHTAHRRTELAEAARSVTTGAGRYNTALSDPTLLTQLLGTPRLPVLPDNLASALDAYEEAFGEQEAGRLRATLFRPAAIPPFVPASRTFFAEAPLPLNAANTAAGATSMALSAGRLFSFTPGSAMRLGLESHFLYSGAAWLLEAASRSGGPAQKSMDGFKPTWLRTLMQCAHHAEFTGDLALAADLVAQASDVLGPLPKGKQTDETLRKLRADCEETGARLAVALENRALG